MLGKIHFETLGCKLNQVESEGAASCFVKSGFTVTMAPFSAAQKSDESVILCVVNTCTVTAKAEQKARRIIRLLLLKCPLSAVVVTGCYAQLNKDELSAIDDRICVLGGQSKAKMADIPLFLMENPLLSGQELSSKLRAFFEEVHKNSVEGVIQSPFRLVPQNFIHHSRPSLKIQDGCNSQCTYCRIRLARGKSVSLQAKEVLRRVKDLEEAGHNEVVITTVNIAQYRSEWNEKSINFTDLLKLILENTKKIKIRISSLYPELVNEEFAAVAKNDRVMPHFHISVQSGSDSILLKMKRPYTVNAVYNACRLLKEAKKTPFLACDIIAGFPGETDEDFDATLKMLCDCGFTFVHAFPFSARPGTEAYKMRPMVPNSVAGTRVVALEKYSEEAKKKYIESFIGKVIPAVAETVHRPKILTNQTVIHAVTENFLHCKLVFKTGQKIPEPGSLINLKIIRPLNKDELSGESDTLAELVSES